MNHKIASTTAILTKDENRDYGVLDASINNRAPSLSSEKIFEVKYSECYGNNLNIDELKNMAIFEILVFESLNEKQLTDIQKNIKNLQELSFEEIDSRRMCNIMRNKKYIEPEYKLISYYFLKNNKLNVVYECKNGNDAFTMMLKNNSIEDTINEYIEKIKKFKENNTFVPKDWTMRVSVLQQILKKETHYNV